MTDLPDRLDSGVVPSPCIKECLMTALAVSDAAELCRGCLRTMDEIVGWGSADQATRRAVWVRIARRRAELGTAPGEGNPPHK